MSSASFLHQLTTLDGLSAVETTITSRVNSEAPQLEEISRYLLELGGKRVRPIVALLSGRACGLVAPSTQLIEVASGIELIHMATLLHDDIIDKSPLRRHQTSPFIKYGTDATLLTGDFLLTRAFGLCARLDRFVIEETEAACVELTEGEILETPLFRNNHTLESYITIARKKTASLFRLAAVCGAHLGASTPELQNTPCEEAMASFGEHLGIAFQMLDDILDVTASEKVLGKKRGVDLHERKPSLINLLWLESGSTLAKKLCTEPLGDDEHFVAAALAELENSAIIASARDHAIDYAHRAAHALEVAASHCPTPHARSFSQLKELTNYVTSRAS